MKAIQKYMHHLVIGIVMSVSFPLFGMNEPTVTRGPYLQLTTSESIVIRWRTDTPTSSRVQYGLSIGKLDSIIDFPTLTTKHEVVLTNLNPHTKYYYSIGSTEHTLAGNDINHHFHTHPIIGDNQPLRIWAIGDSGTGTDNARNVRDAYLGYTIHTPADVWITLGDNAYLLGTDEQYQTKFFDIYPSILRTTSVWPTLGNHAFFTYPDKQTGAFFENFTLPKAGESGGLPSETEAYYSFDYANVHFIALNSYRTDLSVNGPMLTWLTNDLANTNQTWVIAFWHHAPYSDGHSSDDEDEPEMILMRENAVPILEDAGVDLVLTGHSHSYERSYLMDGHYGFSDTLAPSMILDSGDGHELGDGPYSKQTGALAPHEGAIYVVNGSAGQLTVGNLEHPAMPIIHPELGSMVIDIYRTRMDAVFINDQGVVLDRFAITKGDQPCRADLISDGSLNFFDVSEFLRAFLNFEPKADFTYDNSWNFFDVSDFLSMFTNGCQ